MSKIGRVIMCDKAIEYFENNKAEFKVLSQYETFLNEHPCFRNMWTIVECEMFQDIDIHERDKIPAYSCRLEEENEKYKILELERWNIVS